METTENKEFASLYVSESGDYISMLPGRTKTAESAILRMLYKYPDLEGIRLQNAMITPKIESKLARMPKLSHLILQDTSYSSLSFLHEAKNLTELTLHWVSSLKGLGDVRQLKILNADSDTLTDLSILESLQELEELYFTAGNGGDWPANSKVRDVSPLKRLTKLHNLSLAFAGKDLDGFAELKQLRILNLHMERSGVDIAPLANLTQLEGLGLGGCSYDPITDIAPLAGLTNIMVLRIHGQKLKNLETVRNMPKLKRLDCSDNHIRTLKPLENLAKLKELHAQDNAIRDIKALRNLKDLAVLNIGGTNVQDISTLAGLQNLSWLCLNGKVTDLSPLASLHSLKELYLNGYNGYRCTDKLEIDIGPLSGLDKLTTIRIDYCSIKSLEPLQGKFELNGDTLQRKSSPED